MRKTLEAKLKALKKNPGSSEFILADAKDADMAFRVTTPGHRVEGKPRSLAEYRDEMRHLVKQGLVDIMLMSASTSEALTIRERIFENSGVTPAVRANDTTDIHIVRGSKYSQVPSRPFATATIDHIQAGKSPCTAAERKLGANLGLYSVTFNNVPERDLETLEAYKTFRLLAEEKKFDHFLEVFYPNVPAKVHGIPAAKIPFFVNDHIARMLAGVPTSSRPLFLKIPYGGPKAMEEICSYDTSLVIGVLGGSSGTAHDAFALLYQAKKHGARAAIFGRKIDAAESQLLMVEHMRLVADDKIKPAEAVKSYHAALKKAGIPAQRSVEKDLELTSAVLKYAG